MNNRGRRTPLAPQRLRYGDKIRWVWYPGEGGEVKEEWEDVRIQMTKTGKTCMRILSCKIGNLRYISACVRRMFSKLSNHFHFTARREQVYFYLSPQWNFVLGLEGL